MESELRKCVRCGKTIKSISPMRKYCYECRIEMRRVWFENFKKRKERKTEKKKEEKSPKSRQSRGNRAKKVGKRTKN